MTPSEAPATKPDYTALDLPGAPADRPVVLINMVMSFDGRVTVEGTERGLGSKADQQLMRELRVNADCVMNGAATLRASGSSPRVGNALFEEIRRSRGKPPHPYGAVITRSGNLPLDALFFTGEDFEALVYVAHDTPDERASAIASTGRQVVRLPEREPVREMLRHMRQEMGFEVLLVEGGPHLNGELIDGRFVDDFFLTLAPRVVAGDEGLPAVTSPRPPDIERIAHFDLVGHVHNPATQELYLRYRLRR